MSNSKRGGNSEGGPSKKVMALDKKVTSRFYSFNFLKPFLNIYPDHVPLSGDYDIEITESNLNIYQEDGGYLAIAKYTYIKNETLFQTFPETTAAHTVKKDEFRDEQVPTDSIFPHQTVHENYFKTVIIPIAVSPLERKMLSGLLVTTGQTEGQSLERFVSEHDIAILNIVKSAEIGPDVSEITQTNLLRQVIERHMGGEFVMNSVDATKYRGARKQYLCSYSTSRPDVCFYHRHNYFSDSTLIASVATTPGLEIDEGGSESDTETETIYGDKLDDTSRSQGQLVAAMILTATTVGNVAITEGNFFTKAIVFGFTRQIKDDQIIVYRMEMDFKNRKTTLYKGEDSINTATLIFNMKELLRNPQKIKKVRL